MSEVEVLTAEIPPPPGLSPRQTMDRYDITSMQALAKQEKK